MGTIVKVIIGAVAIGGIYYIISKSKSTVPVVVKTVAATTPIASYPGQSLLNSLKAEMTALTTPPVQTNFTGDEFHWQAFR